MKNLNLKTICNIEEQAFSCSHLLEIAKNYCDANYDKCKEIVELSVLINTIIDKHNIVINEIESLYKKLID